jgi:hypothetical protein
LIWVNDADRRDCCNRELMLRGRLAAEHLGEWAILAGHRVWANRRESPMQYIASLRQQAAYYHELAAKWLEANKLEEAIEYEDLAETCEEVADEIEEHLPGG